MWLYRPILSSATNHQNNAIHHDYEGIRLIQPYCPIEVVLMTPKSFYRDSRSGVQKKRNGKEVELGERGTKRKEKNDQKSKKTQKS